MSSNIETQEKITNQIIAALEKGKIPWKRPFQGPQTPKNFTSNKEYRGVNRLILSPMLTGFSSPNWATYKQIAAAGGQVRAGEKSRTIVFWSKFDDKKSPPLKNGKPREVWFMKQFSVFNAEQCDGLDIPAETVRVFDPIMECEGIVNGMPNPPTIDHKGAGRCFYSIATDTVSMSPKESFVRNLEYYGVLFHELIHSTGHAKRLKRDLTGSKGSQSYAKEELIAEIGAAFLCAEAGIDCPELTENTTAYCQGWIKALQNDPKMIVAAAGASQKAMDAILGRKYQAEDKPANEEAVTTA